MILQVEYRVFWVDPLMGVPIKYPQWYRVPNQGIHFLDPPGGLGVGFLGGFEFKFQGFRVRGQASGSGLGNWDLRNYPKGPKDPITRVTRVPLKGSISVQRSSQQGFKAPKDPIIRYLGFGQQLCRRLFARVYDNSALGPLGLISCSVSKLAYTTTY